MARPRKRDRHLPPCVYPSNGAYYHVVGGKWHPLGKDLPAALSEYARRVGALESGGMPALIEKYQASLKGRLKDSTAGQYRSALKGLGDGQIAVLVDVRKDWTEGTARGGLVLHHPKLEVARSNARSPAFRVSDSDLQIFEQLVDDQAIRNLDFQPDAPVPGMFLTDYRDPVAPPGSPPVRAAVQPVLVETREGKARNPKWVVIVQDRAAVP
jgi:hypothetical protein